MFSSIAISMALASGAFAAYSNSTVTPDVPGTTVVTITSCSNDICTPTAITTGVTTATTTDDNGEITTYTTFCPTESSVAPSTPAVVPPYTGGAAGVDYSKLGGLALAPFVAAALL